jgi:hypothetical protein
MPMRGVYRIKNAPPHEDGVWVTDGIAGFEISESKYRDRGYQPAIESLPWRSPPPRRDDGVTDP